MPKLQGIHSRTFTKPSKSPWQSINIPFNCKDLLLFQICSLIISFSRFSIAFFRIRMRNNCCIGIFPNTTACFKPNRPHCESPTPLAVIHGNPRLCQGQATAQDGRLLQKLEPIAQIQGSLDDAIVLDDKAPFFKKADICEQRLMCLVI